jgi:hypothetical protein
MRTVYPLDVEDLSIQIAWDIASEMGPPPVPPWLGEPNTCVRLVELVQKNVVPAWVTRGPMPYEAWRPILDAAFTSWTADSESAPQVPGPLDRKNILLRLWGGCVGAGKMVAETNQGDDMKATVIDEHVRRRAFEGIDRVATLCPIFKAGVLYACDWKQSFDPPQGVCFDGVPRESVVRVRYESARQHQADDRQP